jgi:hypothetical protein
MVERSFFATRSDWVQAITSNFSMRDSQHLKVSDVKDFPLAPDTALLTSQNRGDMQLKSGQSTISKECIGQQTEDMLYGDPPFKDLNR